jgi:hypothetical protein
LAPISDTEQQESQNEEIINIGKSQEYDVESAFSEDATSEIPGSRSNCVFKDCRKRGQWTLH